METKTYRSNGKRWTLPKVLRFGRVIGEYAVEWRNPQEGEWFLSGAVVTAYKALQDMDSPALVATRIYEVREVRRWVRV